MRILFGILLGLALVGTIAVMIPVLAVASFVGAVVYILTTKKGGVKG